MPEPVRKALGRALQMVQRGQTPGNAKHLHGYESGVLEVVEDFDTDTHRAVYTVRFVNVVYVLLVFQKKSAHGTATPRHVLDQVRARLRWAEMDHAASVLGEEE